MPPAEVHDETIRSRLGLHRSQRVVLHLSALFALDAFAGGFVMSSFIAFWFSQRFGVDPALLGAILFGANILAAISALAAAPLAARFGLVRTMVFTHLPSNVLLMLVPFMPTLPLAALGAARSLQHQPDGRADAAVLHDGHRGARRALGRGRRDGHRAQPRAWRPPRCIAAPLLVGSAFTGAPFVIAGGLKIVYDLLLYRGFRATRPPEELPEVED